MEIGSKYNIFFKQDFFKIEKLPFNQNNTLFFVSGRIAIKYIINQLNIKKCLIPNYICESVLNCFNNYKLYEINNDLNINYKNLVENINSDTFDLVLIINYFGYVDSNIEQIKILCKSKQVLILEDFTHNIFSHNLKDHNFELSLYY